MAEPPVTVELPANLSYSQQSSLLECGGRYYLERAQKVPQRPSWAGIGGSAAHSTTEELDRRLYEAGEHIDSLDEIRGLFESFFEQQIRKEEGAHLDEIDRTTRFDRSEFRASGRASREFPEKENHAWWLQKGPEMVLSWVRWRDNASSVWTIAEVYQPFTCPSCEGAGQNQGGPCGMCAGAGEAAEPALAIELETRPKVAGVEVVGYVDRVLVAETEDGPVYRVLDLKFGSYEPKSDEQLVDYRVGLREGYGIDPKWGTFWMGRKGMNTPDSDLHATPYSAVEYRYRMAHEQRMRGDFRYKPGNLCGSCSVKDYCPVMGGQYADTIPQPWEISGVSLRPPRDRV